MTAAQLMRPVMATGIASTRPVAKRLVRQRPLLLPKLPVPAAPVSRIGAIFGQSTAALPRIVPKYEIPHPAIEPLPEKVVIPEGDEDWSAVVVGKLMFFFLLIIIRT